MLKFVAYELAEFIPDELSPWSHYKQIWLRLPLRFLTSETDIVFYCSEAWWDIQASVNWIIFAQAMAWVEQAQGRDPNQC